MPESSMLLIDWEGVGWPLLHRLLDDGYLPHLARLTEPGLIGPLTVPPPIQPWCVSTTLATGRLAIHHDILSPQEADEGRLRPVSSTSVKAPFLWQILASRGRRTAAINWPLTYPAPPQSSLIISDAFFQTRLIDGQLHAPPAQSLWPLHWQDRLAPLRRHASDIGVEDLRRLIPDVGGFELANDQRLGMLAVNHATTLSVADMSLVCLRDFRPNFLAIRFSATAALVPLLLGARPPFDQALLEVFRLLDQILGQLADAAGPDSHILLVSGYRAVGGPLRSASSEASWRDRYQDQGFLCAAGPGVKPSARLLGASVLDIVPTALRLCGLSPDANMPGRVLSEAFDAQVASAPICAWDSCLPSSSALADADVTQGLLLESGQDLAAEVRQLTQRRTLAMAMALAAAGSAAEALDLLEELGQHSSSKESEYWRLLGHLTLDLERGDEARIRSIIVNLEQCDGVRLDCNLLQARIESRAGRHEHALDRLFECLAQAPANPTLHWYIGREYERCGRLEDACQAYANALQCSPGHHASQLALAGAQLALGQSRLARDTALDAIASRFNSARAHWVLGQALEATGDDQHAAEAYRACLALAPGLNEAHQRLLELYGPDRLDQADQLRQQQAALGRLMAARALGHAS